MISPQTQVCLKKFFSTHRPMLQKRKVKNWSGDQMLSATHLHESSHGISACLATCTWNSTCSPGKANITSTVWDLSQKTRKKQHKPNQFIWWVRNLHAWNLTTTEEFNWHGIQNNRKRARKIQSAVIREGIIKADGKYIVDSSHYHHSSVCKGVAGANETRHQSWWKIHSNQWK